MLSNNSDSDFEKQSNNDESSEENLSQKNEI
jgi:hypothetical protein